MPISACTSALSVQGLYRPLNELLDTIENMNEEKRAGRCFAHAQDDLILCIMRMLEGTFSLDTAKL